MILKRISLNRYWSFIFLLGGIFLFFLEMKSIATHTGSDYRIFYNVATRFKINPLELYTVSSVWTLQGFLYPPPAVTLFLPLAALSLESSYKFFVVLLYFSTFCAMALWLRLSDFEDKSLSLSGLEKINVIVLAAVSGPFFAAVVAGQVDILVLLLCTIHITLATRNRPIRSGFVLAVGFWIKIYPVILLAYAFSRPDAKRIFLGFLCGVLTIPLILAPIVPLQLYEQYFLEYLPKLSGGTIVNIYNQSASAFFVRLSLPIEESIRSFQAQVVPTSLRFSISLVAMIMVGSISYAAKQTGGFKLPLFAMILAVFAIFAPLGWGHTYVYIGPLAYFTWFIGKKIQSKVSIYLLAISYAALLIPAYRTFSMRPYFPELVYKILYSRYLFVTLFLIILAAVLIRIAKSDKKGVARQGHESVDHYC